MPATGSLFKNLIVALRKRIVVGLPSLVEGSSNSPSDACEFEVITGTSPVMDLTATGVAQTLTLLPDGSVPAGLKCYITSLQVVPTTAFSGGTAGTVSLTIQDSAATAIATYTQTALSTAGAPISVPAATLPTGVSAAALNVLSTSATAGKGLQAVLSTNSTAGACRIRVVGYFAA